MKEHNHLPWKSVTILNNRAQDYSDSSFRKLCDSKQTRCLLHTWKQRENQSPSISITQFCPVSTTNRTNFVWVTILIITSTRASQFAAEVPIFECKLCTKAQHHRILQKSPVRFRLLTKPSLSFFYMWHNIKYFYLNKWPFLTAFNCHWGMPRPMIKNSPFSRRIKYSWYVSFCQSYLMKSRNCAQSIPDSNSESFRPHHFRSTVRKQFLMDR